MIVNATESSSRIAELARIPEWGRVIEFASRSHIPLRLDPAAPQLELAGVTPVGGRANRALLKVFHAGDGLWAAFFYKQSQIPFSRDRYAYGVVEFSSDGPRAEMAESWFRWIDTGFHPDLHPPDLKRAFSYTVPEK